MPKDPMWPGVFGKLREQLRKAVEQQDEADKVRDGSTSVALAAYLGVSRLPQEVDSAD